MLTIQNYVRAESLQQAYDLYQKKPNRIIGGMLWLRMSDITVGTAIDLSSLGLDKIEETEDSFSIGAMATLRQLEQHEGLNAYTNHAAAQSVKDIVGVQFRNMATVGGSLWSRFGFSDVLTFFLALDASVELFNGGVIPLAEFAEMPMKRDILIRVIVKKRPGCFAYQAVRAARTDFPTLTCAASVMEGEVRVSIGARPGRAMVLRDETGLLSGGITPESAHAFAVYAAKTIPTGTNSRASAAYRTRLVQVLTERTILSLGGNQDAD